MTPLAEAPPPLLASMLCSGLGPACATFFTNPLEVIKTRLQFSGEGGSRVRYASALACARETAGGGWGSLQAGLGAAVVREGSKTFFRYGLFAPFLASLHPGAPGDAPVHARLAAGAAAGAVAATACNPLDLLKCQLQATGATGVRSYEYRTARGALSHIVRCGSISALWVGTSVSIPRSMVSTSVMMTTQSLLKDRALRGGLAPSYAAALAALGAAAATIYAQGPLDTVRARLFSPKNRELTSGAVRPLDVATSIARTEGLTGFYKGAGANFVRYAPHATLSFYLIDELKSRL